MAAWSRLLPHRGAARRPNGGPGVAPVFYEEGIMREYLFDDGRHVSSGLVSMPPRGFTAGRPATGS